MPDSSLILKAMAEKELRRRRGISFDDWLKKYSPYLNWDLPHLQYMRREFDHIANRTKALRVMNFMPPQHGKTTQNTIHFTAFYLYKNPTSNIVVAADRQDFANKFSRRIRSLASKCVTLSRERKAVSEWETELGGSVTCGGIGIGTGLPIDLLIIDDPIKEAKDARSKTYRESLWEWWQYSIAPRIKPTTSILFTMTPWHEDDLAARILENQPDEWEIVRLPAICEEENDPIGRKIGEALWPEEFPIEDLRKKQAQNPAAFQALHQLRPSAKEGTIFLRKDFQYFNVIPQFKYIVQSWDTAFKKNETNDFSVCQTWGITNTGYYLLHTWRKRCEYPQMKRAMLALYDKFKPRWVLIEDKASGQSVVQELLQLTDLPVKPIKPSGSKEDRAATVSAMFEAKRVYFPARASWLLDFTEELAMFPNGRHDDQIDAMTQALNFVKLRTRHTPKLITF